VLAEDFRIDYNTYRPHSSLDYLAPSKFAEQLAYQRSRTLRVGGLVIGGRSARTFTISVGRAIPSHAFVPPASRAAVTVVARRRAGLDLPDLDRAVRTNGFKRSSAPGARGPRPGRASFPHRQASTEPSP
jgi:hypothetical protein